MTRLLVSVRSVDEALVAASTGVDLIDVKEPARGPLGMADAKVRREIADHLGAQHTLSAACGELRDFVARSVSEGDKVADTGDEPSSHIDWIGYRFAKIGLSGCAADSIWREKWLVWRSWLPTFVEPVLVCYADGDRCDAPSYNVLHDFAIEHGIGMLLFDTWDKQGPGLCELWQAADFLRVSQELRRANISFVFAGKLGLENVSTLSHFRASYLGIRGAVCDSAHPNVDSRCGKLNPAKIQTWRQGLKSAVCNTTHQPASIDA